MPLVALRKKRIEAAVKSNSSKSSLVNNDDKVEDKVDISTANRNHKNGGRGGVYNFSSHNPEPLRSCFSRNPRYNSTPEPPPPAPYSVPDFDHHHLQHSEHQPPSLFIPLGASSTYHLPQQLSSYEQQYEKANLNHHNRSYPSTSSSSSSLTAAEGTDNSCENSAHRQINSSGPSSSCESNRDGTLNATDLLPIGDFASCSPPCSLPFLCSRNLPPTQFDPDATPTGVGSFTATRCSETSLELLSIPGIINRRGENSGDVFPVSCGGRSQTQSLRNYSERTPHTDGPDDGAIGVEFSGRSNANAATTIMPSSTATAVAHHAHSNIASSDPAFCCLVSSCIEPLENQTPPVIRPSITNGTGNPVKECSEGKFTFLLPTTPSTCLRLPIVTRSNTHSSTAGILNSGDDMLLDGHAGGQADSGVSGLFTASSSSSYGQHCSQNVPQQTGVGPTQQLLLPIMALARGNISQQDFPWKVSYHSSENPSTLVNAHECLTDDTTADGQEYDDEEECGGHDYDEDDLDLATANCLTVDGVYKKVRFKHMAPEEVYEYEKFDWEAEIYEAQEVFGSVPLDSKSSLHRNGLASPPLELECQDVDPFNLFIPLVAQSPITNTAQQLEHQPSTYSLQSPSGSIGSGDGVARVSNYIASGNSSAFQSTSENSSIEFMEDFRTTSLPHSPKACERRSLSAVDLNTTTTSPLAHRNESESSSLNLWLPLRYSTSSSSRTRDATPHPIRCLSSKTLSHGQSWSEESSPFFPNETSGPPWDDDDDDNDDDGDDNNDDDEQLSDWCPHSMSPRWSAASLIRSALGNGEKAAVFKQDPVSRLPHLLQMEDNIVKEHWDNPINSAEPGLSDWQQFPQIAEVGVDSAAFSAQSAASSSQKSVGDEDDNDGGLKFDIATDESHRNAWLHPVFRPLESYEGCEESDGTSDSLSINSAQFFTPMNGGDSRTIRRHRENAADS